MAKPRERVRLSDGDFAKTKDKGGRPKGSMSRFSTELRAAARETGALPHELLLAWSRGEPMSRKVCMEGCDPRDPSTWKYEYTEQEPDWMRDSAKAAAPYYAPKISTVEVIQGVSDADLNEFIARAAAEAGISIGHGGEGTEDPRTSPSDEDASTTD